MYNPYTLSGKTILITGASSGIGRSTAVECSKLGANVIITGRDEQRLSATLSLLEGTNHQIILADITSEEGIQRVVEQVPNLDGVVNNAGISNTKLINFVKGQDLQSLFSINTFAPILLTKELLKKKTINKGASLVFVSSIASVNPDIANSVYSATKSALSSFSRSCAKELASKKIRSNALLPGMVQTELVQNLVFSEEELEKDMANYPLKRYGKPEEIAWAIIYLLSDASAWVTGTQLIIDGGKLLV